METIGIWSGVWLGSFLFLALSIVVIRHVAVPHRWRSVHIPLFLIGAVLVVLIGTIGAGTLAALILTIPAGIVLFSVGLWILVYNSLIGRGMVHYREKILDEHPEVRASFDQNRYLSRIRRFSDWFGE